MRSAFSATSKNTREVTRTGAATAALLLVLAGTVEAQNLQLQDLSVQIQPFGGYRFGGDLFEAIAGTRLDIDGAPVLGVTGDVFIGGGQSVTFLYSRQRARIDVPTPDGPVVRATFAVDHWHVGGAQEIDLGAVRPFYGAGLGLTYLGTQRDSEVRFSFGGGGGVKLMPSQHVGVRLDARGYGVVVHGDLAGVCVNGLCATRIHAHLAWQIEFTAGLVIAF